MFCKLTDFKECATDFSVEMWGIDAPIAVKASKDFRFSFMTGNSEKKQFSNEINF
jgi:hypothetical protein